MATLEAVLIDFDRRLKAIESKLGLLPNKEEKKATPSFPKAPLAFEPPKPVDETPVGGEEWSEESSFSEPPTPASSSILAFIGIFFVILAGIFFIKITITSGWLTPMRQIVISSAVGLLFFLIPHFVPKAERQYGSLLAGAGTTILHLTWLAAYFFHHILDPSTALLAATVVGVCSLMTKLGQGNRIYILVAMAGTYLSAPLIGYGTREISVLSIFLIIWNISFSVAALVNRRRDILFIASYYAVFTVLLLSGKQGGVELHSQLLILQVIQFVVFSIAMVSYTLFSKKPLSAEESLAVLPMLLLFYFATRYSISFVSPDLAPWFGILVGVVILGIHVFTQSFVSTELNSGPVLISFATITFVHSVYFQLASEALQPLIALGLGIGLVFIGRQGQLSKIMLWPMIILGCVVVHGALMTLVSENTLVPIYLFNWAYGALALIGILALGRERKSEGVSGYQSVLLGFGHLEVLLGLYRFSQQLSWSGAFFVTLTWGLYALTILGIAYRRKDKTLGNSALVILLAVSLKACFYDVINTSSLIRVVCLLVEGILLYGCGWIFKRMEHW